MSFLNDMCKHYRWRTQWSTNIWGLQSIEREEFYDVEWEFNQDWWVEFEKKKKNVQEEEQKNYPDWKASLFVEMMVVSCCVAEIKGREDF